MELAEAVALYREAFYGHAGRPGMRGGSKARSSASGGDLASRLARDNGFTYNPASGAFPQTGYALSVYKGAEKKFEASKIQASDIEGYLKEHSATLKADPRAHLGAWFNASDGNVYLDLSMRAPDLTMALDLAHKHNQLAIYDLKAGREITTPQNWGSWSAGEKRTFTMAQKKKITEAAEKKKLVRMDFKRTASAEQIAKAIRDLAAKHGYK